MQQLDTTITWEVIGLDLAKFDVSAFALPVDEEQFHACAVDRMSYEELTQLAEQLPPTVFVLEPCTGYSHLKRSLEAWGHQVKVISGQAVKHWIDSHCNGQKTDLNDARALAHLHRDKQLRSVRGKTPQESRLLALQALRFQLVNQRTKSIVCLKSLCQEFGLPLKAGLANWKKLAAQLDLLTEKTGPELLQQMKNFLLHIQQIEQSLRQIDRDLERLTRQDYRAELLLSIPGIGIQITSRLLATLGSIERFSSPRSVAAYYGLVPQNRITGHRVLTPGGQHLGQGKISRHGDRLMRALIIQGANSLCIMRERMPDCPLKHWLLRQLNAAKPRNKVMVSAAAKLLRIVYAVLMTREPFSWSKAARSRSAPPLVLQPAQPRAKALLPSRRTIVVKEPSPLEEI